MDQYCVAELQRSETGLYKRSYGTGYLIRRNLILTCHHVVIPENVTDIDLAKEVVSTFKVRFIGDYQQGRYDWVADVLKLSWYNQEHDLALLEIANPPIFLTSEYLETKFIKPDKNQRKIKATGFPKFKKIENVHCSYQITAQTNGLNYHRTKHIELQGLSPEVPNDHKEWQGISGAAVFDDETNLLVGVIGLTDLGKSSCNLWVKPIDALISNSTFWSILGTTASEAFCVQNICEEQKRKSDRGDKIEQHLQSLNYNVQTTAVKDSSPGKIFLLPPNDSQVQEWLIKRLLFEIREHRYYRKINLTATNLWNTNFDHFWRTLHKHVDDGSINCSDHEKIIENICTYQGRDRLIISIQSIDILNDNQIKLLMNVLNEQLMKRMERDSSFKYVLLRTQESGKKINKEYVESLAFPRESMTYLADLDPWEKVTAHDINEWFKSIEVYEDLEKYTKSSLLPVSQPLESTFLERFCLELGLPLSPRKFIDGICELCDINFYDLDKHWRF
jgi:Trypsin-like peptidase domain